MVTLAQLQYESASERVRQIWCGIVQFANADLADKSAFEDFIKLLARCSYSSSKDIEEPLTTVGCLTMGLAEEMVAGMAAEMAEVTTRIKDGGSGKIKPGVVEVRDHDQGLFWFLTHFDELKVCADNEGLIPFEALKSLAVKYQKDFKGLVTWLCVPPDDEPAPAAELAPAAVQFLQGNLHRTRFRLTYNCFRLRSDFPPFFYWRSEDYYSIMEPICQFIFDRIERYHAGELDLRQAVPIRICERADCGKFILPERSSKRYCSGGCRAQAFQKRAGVKWATYMREYRKDRKDREDRKRRGKRRRKR